MESDYLPIELGMILNSYCAGKRIIKIQCFLMNSPIQTELKKTNPIFDYQINIKKQQDFARITHFTCSITDTKSDSTIGTFQLIAKEDELYAITGEKAVFFKNVLLKMLRGFYPSIIPAFIHSDGIYEVLDNFEKSTNIDLKKKKAVEKQIFGQSPRTEISYETKKIGREYPTFKEAFEEARNNDSWIDRIQILGANPIINQHVQFSLSRRGDVSIEKGTFDMFFSYILSPIIKRSKDRREQFSHRSRKEQDDKKSHPLIVNFRKDIFKDVKTRKEFSRILDKYPHCNYSIIHDGNPHVYLSVLDRLDNSSFSVRTIGHNSLLLIPQIKTSSLALMRFSEFLVSSFYEGVIQNYEKKSAIH